MSLLTLALALFQASVAAPTPSSAVAPASNSSVPQVITYPDWVRRPTGADLVWPAGAYYAHASGHVVLGCLVNEKGRLNHCQALVDEPPGWGFGAAAIEMAEHYFQMRPMTRDGKPVTGATIHIPIDYLWPR